MLKLVIKLKKARPKIVKKIKLNIPHVNFILIKKKIQNWCETDYI